MKTSQSDSTTLAKVADLLSVDHGELINPSKMAKNNHQSDRLTTQHQESEGVIGIFGEGARIHDLTVGKIQQKVLEYLEHEYPQLSFRIRAAVTKEEINSALQKIDPELGQTLFVPNSRVRPDGGITEVKDDQGNWRIILVSEAKEQGRDIENIRKGIGVGRKNNQDLMVAGNAIERAHKNISEIANLMLAESHFPYVLFLEGSNFLTETISIKRPDGRAVSWSIIQARSIVLTDLRQPIMGCLSTPICVGTSSLRITIEPLCFKLPQFIRREMENNGILWICSMSCWK